MGLIARALDAGRAAEAIGTAAQGVSEAAEPVAAPDDDDDDAL